MRILVFSTDDFLFPAGGAETAFGEIARRLPDVEFDLICAKLRRGTVSRDRVNNIGIHRLGLGIKKIDGLFLYFLGGGLGLRLHRAKKFDLVWSVMASYGSFAALEFKKNTGLPFLLTLQEGKPVEQIARKGRLINLGQVFSGADALQSISSYLEQWGKDMGFRGEISEIIPNGVDYKFFSSSFSSDEIDKRRKDFNFKNGGRIMITTSRLVEKNGVRHIIEAMPLMPEDVNLVICGSGNLEESLKKLAEQRGLSDRVRFLGFVDRADLPLLLKASDIFIRPSLSEGFGNSFIEAMAAGIPVIGTDAGGLKDFLKDGYNGFVCRPADPDSIARTVGRICSMDEKSRAEIIKNALEFSAGYDWDIIAEKMRGLFNKILK